MKLKQHTISSLVGAILLTAAAAASADDSSDWQYNALVYGWLPDLSGELNSDLPGGGGSGTIDVEKILDVLKMTFMGTFEARKGDMSAFADVIYMDLADDQKKSVTLPSGGTVDLFDSDFGMESWVLNFGGSYTVWRDQVSHLDLLAGARYIWIDTELELKGQGPIGIKVKQSETVDLWDGIVGAKGQIGLSENWFLRYYADVGTGGSDLSWQLMGGVGYTFDWGSVLVDYRHLEIEQDDDKLIANLAFSGPMIGVAFQF